MTGGDHALGRLIADAQLAATASPGFGEALVAFMNPGGIRADFTYLGSSAGEGDGNVTYGEAFTVQPFGNSLVTMTLTGAQIETLLEQQFVGCGQAFNRILQVSAGFQYSWNASGPACDKVDPQSIRIDGLALDLNTAYRVTVNSSSRTAVTISVCWRRARTASAAPWTPTRSRPISRHSRQSRRGRRTASRSCHKERRHDAVHPT